MALPAHLRRAADAFMAPSMAAATSLKTASGAWLPFTRASTDWRDERGEERRAGQGKGKGEGEGEGAGQEEG